MAGVIETNSNTEKIDSLMLDFDGFYCDLIFPEFSNTNCNISIIYGRNLAVSWPHLFLTDLWLFKEPQIHPKKTVSKQFLLIFQQEK